MFSLWMFGVIIERSLGSQKYLIYYISCGLGAALLQEGIFALMINHYAGLFENGNAICNVMRNSQVTYGQLFDLQVSPYDGAITSIMNLYHTPTVGASGAIYGILLAFGFLFPQMRIYLMFPPMPLRARTAVILFAAIELILGIYNSQADTVAHFAHLGGMLVGLLILIWWKKNGIIRPFF
jgi:membrane associated rhomboid family serine protease